MTADTIAIELLAPSASDDAGLVAELAALVSRVYAVAESGLWRDGAMRTTPSEVAELIRAREIAVATRDGRVVGCVRIHDVAADTSEFGVLVAAPEERGTGVGRELLDFAEDHSRDRELRAIQLELLVPREFTHPSKEFLKVWYGRRGYRLTRTGNFEAAYPHLAPLLATPCDLEVHTKPLG